MVLLVFGFVRDGHHPQSTTTAAGRIMNRREFVALTTMAAMGTKLRAQAPQSGICQPVLKRAYDNSNSGANLKETVFTQANVAARGIAKIFSLPMEGDARGCEAQ